MKINDIIQDDAMQLIKNSCQRYLNEVGGIDRALVDIPLWRGISRFEFDDNEPLRIVPVNQSRRPMHIKADIQNALDDWFEQKFGIRFRQSSAFCTGNQYDAASYGTAVIVLPVGDYDYCWSPDVGDLFIELQRNKGLTMQALLEQNHYKCNEGLISAIESSNEIMLHCQSIMLINPTGPALYKDIR